MFASLSAFAEFMRAFPARPASRARRRIAGITLASFAAAFGGRVRAADPAYVIPAPYRSTSAALPVRSGDAEPGTQRHADPLESLLRWDVRLDDLTLARTLDRWAAEAGYVVRWEVGRPVPIGAPDSYGGTFEGALEMVLNSAGIVDGDYPLEACVYPNSPPLVRITRRGEQARECPFR